MMKIISCLIQIFLLTILGVYNGNIHANTNKEVTGIHKAALDGNLPKVKSLLEKNPQLLEANDQDEKKPLHFAAQGGQLEVAKFLIQKGAKINSQNNEKDTPLHYACGYGRLPVVEYLVSKGANINAKSNYGTPAYIASWFRKPDVLKFLINKGADLTYTEEGGFGILHHWGFGDSSEIIELLIDKGMPVDAKTEEGRTPLHNAAGNGNLEIVKTLIKRGANVNASSKTVQSPLFLAVDSGKKEIISILLESGSKVNFVNKKTMQTSLHRAAIHGFGKIASRLIENGANLDIKDNLGLTPLYYACRYGHKTVAKILNSKGAKWTEDAKKEKEKDNFANSPLLQKKFKPGNALVWYLGHSGFAVKTTNHLLIFDYFKFRSLPDSPLLANGSISPDELKDINVTVFASHSHGDHFSPIIFDWKKDIKKITYIMGFEPEGQSGYTFIPPRQTKKMNDMEITSIESNDSGVGFFVRVDGVSIFHPGDHANRQQDFSGPFKQEIEFLAKKGLNPDIFFAPVSGCGFGDLEAVKKGVFYTMKALSPKILVPMHAGNNEARLVSFAKKTLETGFTTPICCATNSGDWFFVSQGQVKKSRFKTLGEDCQLSKKGCQPSKNCEKTKKSCKKNIEKSSCEK